VRGFVAGLLNGALVQLLTDLRQEGLGQDCRMMVQVCKQGTGKVQ
jgi:hypothetical protein